MTRNELSEFSYLFTVAKLDRSARCGLTPLSRIVAARVFACRRRHRWRMDADAEFGSATNEAGSPTFCGAMREEVNALPYLLTSGGRWRLLPKKLPRFRRFGSIFAGAGISDCSKRSITLSPCGCAGRPAAKPAPVPRSSQRIGQDRRNRRSTWP